MLNKMKINIVFSLVAIFMALILTGCGPTPPTLVYDRGEFVRYKVHYEFQKEQWDDPEVLSTPRLQFDWRNPEEPSKFNSIWSMRLDGSDLRQAAGLELLHQPAPGIIRSDRVHKRSPNNRYIAVVMISGCGSCAVVRIIDLKEQKTIQLDPNKHDGANYFYWTGDSRYLVFNGRGFITEHDMETGKTELIIDRFYTQEEQKQFPSIWGDAHNPGDFVLFDNGNKIYFLRDDKRIVHDYKTGKFLYDLPRDGLGTSSILSADNKVYVTSLKRDEKLNSSFGLSTFEKPRESQSYLHSEMLSGRGVTLDGYSGVYQNSDNDIAVAIPGENRIVRYELPEEDNKGKRTRINNLSLNNSLNYVNNNTD